MQLGILYGSLLDFSYKEHCIHSGELALYAFYLHLVSMKIMMKDLHFGKGYFKPFEVNPGSKLITFD